MPFLVHPPAQLCICLYGAVLYIIRLCKLAFSLTIRHFLMSQCKEIKIRIFAAKKTTE